jgi:hypothetical protein
LHPITFEKDVFAEEFHGKDGLEVDWELPFEYEKYLIKDDFPYWIYNRFR